MPEFVLDLCDAQKQFASLDSFTQAYIEAAFFTECEPGTTIEDWNPETQSNLPGDMTFDDLAPGTLARMIADCQKFQYGENAVDYSNAYKDESRIHSSEDSMAGHDFWLTRNGHGAGFWGGDWLEPYAAKLTKAAKTFGAFGLYRGDDGKIYA